MPGRLSPLLVRALLIVLALALVGVLAGVAWEWIWRPPTGVVPSDRGVLGSAGPDLAFSGTGWYVVVGGLAGLLSAAAIAWLVPGHELLTLASVVAGAALAGWLMRTVGHALGPDEPQVRADDAALVAFPFGALAGLAVVFLSTWGRPVRNPLGADGPRVG